MYYLLHILLTTGYLKNFSQNFELEKILLTAKINKYLMIETDWKNN